MKVIDFIQTFSEKYVNTIKDRSNSIKLNDIRETINDITPGKLGEVIQATSNSKISPSKNTTENGELYLNFSKIYLYNYLLDKTYECKA